MDHIKPPVLDDGLKSVIIKLREMTSELRTPMLNHGLVLAVEELISVINQRDINKTEYKIDISTDDTRYDPTFETHLYRIVQQACENAHRHANATKILIHGHYRMNNIFLVIEDDGIGFSQDF